MFGREFYVSRGPRRDHRGGDPQTRNDQGNRGGNPPRRDNQGNRGGNPPRRDNQGHQGDGHHVRGDGRQRQRPFDLIRNRAEALWEDTAEALWGFAPEIHHGERDSIRREVGIKQNEVASDIAREEEHDARSYRRIIKTKLGLRGYRISTRQTRGKLEKAAETALIFLLDRERRRINKYLKLRTKIRSNCNEVLDILDERSEKMRENRDNSPESVNERYAFRREISDMDERVHSLMQWQRGAELKLRKANELLGEIHANMQNPGFVLRQADDILRLAGLDVVVGAGLTLDQANAHLAGALDHHIVTEHLDHHA